MRDYEKGLRKLCESLSLREFDIDAGEYIASEAHLNVLRRELLPLLEAAQEAISRRDALDELAEELAKWQ